jgi:hypothetical protein
MTAARVTAGCTLGIAALLFVAGAAAERGGVLESASIDLAARVEQAIGAESAFAVERIDAEASEGIVTLRGSVSSVEGRANILDVARSVPGVQIVRDELRVADAARKTRPARF